MTEYRVNLDIYNGPMDLLLYLIRREEVDIYDIPIARLTTQYIQHVDMLRQIDPNLAGEFLVLAATLMEIKTRMLLPSLPDEQGAGDGVGLDPRAELVRQLLEYKAFKDAAADLTSAAEVQTMKFARQTPPAGADGGEFDLEDVQVWDLLDAFSKLLAATGQTSRLHEVIYDDTPQELHQADLLDRLQREGPLAFTRLFAHLTNKIEMVGLFLALLELVRQKKIAARQDANFEEIYIELKPETPADVAAEQAAEAAADARTAELSQGPAAEAQSVSADPFADAEAASEGDAPAQDDLADQENSNLPSDADLSLELPPAPEAPANAPAGQYVSHAPPIDETQPPAEPEENHDDPGTETQGTGN